MAFKADKLKSSSYTLKFVAGDTEYLRLGIRDKDGATLTTVGAYTGIITIKRKVQDTFTIIPRMDAVMSTYIPGEHEFNIEFKFTPDVTRELLTYDGKDRQDITLLYDIELRNLSTGDITTVLTGTIDVLKESRGPKGSHYNTTTTDVGLPTGEPGPQGPTGPRGPKGPPGPRGADGAAGVQGTDGADGTNGSNGSDGEKGDRGDAGFTGPPGLDGPQGPTGSIGSAGIDGAQGLTGPAGPTGADGDPGIPGPTGSQGPQGQDGIKGDTGLQGSGITISGAADYATVIATAGAAGEMWIVTDAGTGYTVGDGFVSDGGGAGATHWTNTGPVKGDKGEDGATGATGTDGGIGPVGPAGSDGVYVANQVFPSTSVGGVGGKNVFSSAAFIDSGVDLGMEKLCTQYGMQLSTDITPHFNVEFGMQKVNLDDADNSGLFYVAIAPNGYTDPKVALQVTGTSIRPLHNGATQMTLGQPAFRWGNTYTVGINATLPTSDAGLVTGDMWNDSGTVKIKL